MLGKNDKPFFFSTHDWSPPILVGSAHVCVWWWVIRFERLIGGYSSSLILLGGEGEFFSLFCISLFYADLPRLPVRELLNPLIYSVCSPNIQINV